MNHNKRTSTEQFQSTVLLSSLPNGAIYRNLNNPDLWVLNTDAKESINIHTNKIQAITTSHLNKKVTILNDDNALGVPVVKALFRELTSNGIMQIVITDISFVITGDELTASIIIMVLSPNKPLYYESVKALLPLTHTIYDHYDSLISLIKNSTSIIRSHVHCEITHIGDFLTIHNWLSSYEDSHIKELTDTMESFKAHDNAYNFYLDTKAIINQANHENSMPSIRLSIIKQSVPNFRTPCYLPATSYLRITSTQTASYYRIQC